MSSGTLTIHTDGGARGNPGPAGIGVVIADERGKIVKEISKYIGEKTNNQAEYHALIYGLSEVKKLKTDEVSVMMDSELIVKQMKREYRVKNKELASLFVKAFNMSQGFVKITYHHIPREKNKRADQLVNQALDERDKPKSQRTPSPAFV